MRRLSLHKKMIPFLLLLVLILSMWLLPSATPALGIGLILLSLGMAIFAILQKHRDAYRRGRMTRTSLLRRIALDVFGVLLAVALAGLLARHAVGLATRSIGNQLAQLIAGMVIGLLVGAGVAALVNWAWGRVINSWR